MDRPDGEADGLVLPTIRQAITTDDGSVLAAVCSHDCDMENPRNRTGLVVAPIVRVPANPTEELYASIMNSYRPDDGGAWEWIHLFPLILPKHGDVQAVVDLSAMTTVGRPNAVMDELVGNKQYELTDEMRARFGQKIAAFFGRGS